MGGKLSFVLLLSLGAAMVLRDFHQEVKAKAVGWTVAEPDELPYADMTLEQLSQIFPANPSLSLMKEIPRIEPEDQVVNYSLPDSFDARKKWPNCIHPVRNQGACGSCYAHGSTEILSDRFCIHSEGKINVVLAPQDAVSCGGLVCHGCSGCVYPYLWSYLHFFGAVTEECFPYQTAVTPCVLSAKKCVDEKVPFKKYYPKSGSTRYPYKNVDKIKSEIMTNGPVAAIINVYIEYLYYKGGIFTTNSGTVLGTHFVKLLGWGRGEVEGKPVEYWLVQDSQGTAFGENGHSRIKMGVATIDSHVSWVMPDLNV